jgi:putative membrane protein
MRRGFVRWVVAVVLAVVGVGFPAAGIAVASQHTAVSARAGADVIDQRDREFVTLIRFANLWEIPTARLGLERGTTDAVKTAAATMVRDHTRLDVIVKQFANKYGFPLPDKPKSSQQNWMGEISGKHGKDFERTWATRLRAAHGSVFQTIAEERAGTKNAAMLDFATQANAIVLKHMTLLEATGYVDPVAGHFAEAAGRTTADAENVLSSRDIILAVAVFLVVATGTVVGVRVLSSARAAN